MRTHMIDPHRFARAFCELFPRSCKLQYQRLRVVGSVYAHKSQPTTIQSQQNPIHNKKKVFTTMLSNLQQRLSQRYTGTECFGSLIVAGPPTETKNVQSIDSISQGLKKRYTNTEMYGTLVLNEPPVSEHPGPTMSELSQGLKRRCTDTEMCGSLIIHGPPTSPTDTEHRSSKWFDPMDEVRGTMN